MESKQHTVTLEPPTFAVLNRYIYLFKDGDLVPFRWKLSLLPQGRVEMALLFDVESPAKIEDFLRDLNAITEKTDDYQRYVRPQYG